MTDHRIASPSPRNTLLYDVPNSCNAAECHANRSPEWASGYVDEWFPGFQDREAERIRPFALGKLGDRKAIDALEKRLSSALTTPVWRAVAATLLGQLNAETSVETLIESLSDPYPMVRLRSAIALGRIGDGRAISPLVSALTDSLRPIRIYAAFALSDLDFQPPRGEVFEAFQLALAEYEQMVDHLHRDDPGLLDGLGELRERAGQYDQARLLFERVRKLDPNHPETEEDLTRIASLADAFSLGEPILRKVVEDWPIDFAARGRLGRFYLDHHRTQPAGLQLRGAAAQLNSVAILLGEAQAAAGEGDVEGAIHSVLKALDIKPRHRKAAQDLTRLVLSFGSDVRNAGLAEMDSAWGWWETGLSHARSGDFPESRAAFMMSLSRESDLLGADSADVRSLVGLTREGLIQLDRWAGRVFARGTTAYDAGRLEEAEQNFRDCVALNPADSRGYLLLSLVLDDQERSVEAAAQALEGSLMEPAFAEVYSVLGAVAQNAGRIEEAVTHYRTALAFNPRAPGVVVNLSQLHMIKGQQDSARLILQRFLKLDANDQPALEMLREIEAGS